METEDFVHLSEIKKRSDQGCTESQIKLVLYYFNNDTKEDNENGFYWAKLVAIKEHPIGQFYLAYAYEKGKGVEQDYEQAFHWASLAAKTNSFAMYRLAYMYLDGVGTSKDFAKYIEYLTRSANCNNVEAQYELALEYDKDGKLETDLKKACGLYEKAAKKGYAKAQTNLATLLSYGEGGVKKDLEQAIIWYKLAALQGCLKAKTCLGMLSLHGVGVKKNPNEAMYWFKRAADEGDQDAQYYLGLIYEDLKKYKLAYDYLCKSANQGHIKAKERVDAISIQIRKAWEKSKSHFLK